MSPYLDNYLNHEEDSTYFNKKKELDLMDLLINRMEKNRRNKMNYLRKNFVNHNNDNDPIGNVINDNDYDLYSSDSSGSNHEFKALDGNSNNRLENPFFVDSKKNGLNKLILNSGSDNFMMDHFNTDTRIEALGGLSLWQFTAIIILILISICLFIYLIKKANEYSKHISFSNRWKHSQFKNSLSRSVKLSSYIYRRSVNENNPNNKSNNNVKNNIKKNVNNNTSNQSIINSSASTNTTAASSNNQLISNSFLYHTNHINNNNNIKNFGIGVYENITTSSEHYKSLPNFV